MPSPEQMAAKVEQRTGRRISEWLALVPEATFTQQSEFLVAEHGLKPSDARAVLHLGVRLGAPGEVAPAGRPAVAGSFGSGNITHRIALTAPEDVDADVRGWLRAAYDGAAG